MANYRTVAGRLRAVFEALGVDVPIALRGWDGSRSGPADAPALAFRHPRALRRLLWQPNQLGLGRAWVAGELSVEGDLYETLRRLESILTMPSGDAPKATEALRGGLRRDGLLRDLVALGAIGPQPAPPPEEAWLAGTRHSVRRDRRAISHHYDVGNDFYVIVLGETMVYSCAYWTSDAPSYGLDDGQHDKLELICRKLALEPGMRLLDVGCGWGSLAIHAAREHGVSVLGLTISQEQADLARKRVAEVGLAGQVEIRLQDYREVDDGPFDAIASIGMAEHVGISAYAEYASILFHQLRRGGRLLNHQIAEHPTVPPAPPPSRSVFARQPAPSFIQAYVFPDGELAPLGTTVSLLEAAGFEVRDVESLREHYARTLRAWVANLEENWSAAVRLTTPGRARVWRMYMAGSAVSFEAGRIGVNQVLAVKPHADGRSALPATRLARLTPFLAILEMWGSFSSPTFPRSRVGSALTCDLSVTYFSLVPDDDLVFKALADPTRRFLLDLLFARDGRTLGELESEVEMTRFGVMKHLRILEDAGLVVTRKVGREKHHFLNPVPIREIHDRWIDKYTEHHVTALLDLKNELESKE